MNDTECLAITTMTPAWILEVSASYQGNAEAGGKIIALLLDEKSEPNYTYLNGLLKSNPGFMWVPDGKLGRV